MTLEEKQEFLKSKGWSTWYNPKYWVHPEMVEDPASMDYTNYGMNIDDAIRYEKIGKPKFKLFPIPVMSQLDMALRTKDLTENPDEVGE